MPLVVTVAAKSRAYAQGLSARCVEQTSSIGVASGANTPLGDTLRQ